MHKKSIKYIVFAGIIAAIYTVLTYALAFMSYGPVQIRVAEALTLLPILSGAAIPGIAVGCFLANLLYYGIWDAVFGGLTTFAAALLTRALRKKPLLAAAPPVILNAVYLGIYLNIIANAPVMATMLYTLIGQAIACYGLGLPLIHALKKSKHISEMFY